MADDFRQIAPHFRRHAGVGARQAVDGLEGVLEQIGMFPTDHPSHDLAAHKQPPQFKCPFPAIADLVGRAIRRPRYQ